MYSVQDGSKTVVYVDGLNLVFRSHFALRGLTDGSNRPTAVFHGFLTTLLRLQKAYPNACLAIVWEGVAVVSEIHEPGWRKKLYPQYKAQRKKSAETQAALSQVPVLVRVLKTLGYCQVGCPGLEADDVIGVCTANLGWRSFIYSSDTDFYQVIDDRIKVIRSTKGEKFSLVDSKKVKSKLGLEPKEVAKLKALMGDSSDNYPGLQGVGPKRALKMVCSGIDPSVALFTDLPQSVQNNYPEIEMLWGSVGMYYRLALIPRSFGHRDFPPGSSKWLRSAVYDIFNHRFHQTSVARRVESFSRFCAAYDLRELLSHKYQFFSERKK